MPKGSGERVDREPFEKANEQNEAASYLRLPFFAAPFFAPPFFAAAAFLAGAAFLAPFAGEAFFAGAALALLPPLLLRLLPPT